MSRSESGQNKISSTNDSRLRTSTVRGGTLGDAFDPRNNSLNFLRVLLALTVLVSHDIYLGGQFGNEAFLNDTSLGTIAVYGFFGISGFLIAASASHNNVGRYVWQRFLRIFPGFWVAIGLTAFLFGSVAWVTTSHHPPGFNAFLSSKYGPFEYVYSNWLLKINQAGISGGMTKFFPLDTVLRIPLLSPIGFSRFGRHTQTSGGNGSPYGSGLVSHDNAHYASEFSSELQSFS